MNEDKFDDYYDNNLSLVHKEKMLIHNIMSSVNDQFSINEIPEDIKILIDNENVIIVSLPIFKYEGHTFSVDEFNINEVSERLNKGEKFAIYLVKEDLKTIRGANLNKYIGYVSKEEAFEMIFKYEDISDKGITEAQNGSLIEGSRTVASKSKLFFVNNNEFSKLCDYCLLRAEDKEYYDTIFIDNFIFKKSV